MSFAALLAATAATVATPSPEALDLARQVAANGLLATLAPIQAQGEVEELIAENPDLGETERARLRAIGEAKAAELVAGAIEAEAGVMASNLSLEDLRALAAFASSPAARHQREAMPAIIGATLGELGDVDYLGSVREAFCGESGKLCDD